MNVHILTQVLRQRRYTSSANSSLRQHVDEKNDEKLIYKDVAGFIIFLVVAFSLVMVVAFG